MARPSPIVVGQTYGLWHVLSREKPRFYCRCLGCGLERLIPGNYLTRSRSCKSCSKVKNIVGQRFGKWTVLAPCKTGAKYKWLCRCDCGVEKQILSYMLRHGKSKSCGRPGCIQRGKRNDDKRKRCYEFAISLFLQGLEWDEIARRGNEEFFGEAYIP